LDAESGWNDAEPRELTPLQPLVEVLEVRPSGWAAGVRFRLYLNPVISTGAFAFFAKAQRRDL
jgi:hypothetical protein